MSAVIPATGLASQYTWFLDDSTGAALTVVATKALVSVADDERKSLRHVPPARWVGATYTDRFGVTHCTQTAPLR